MQKLVDKSLENVFGASVLVPAECSPLCKPAKVAGSLFEVSVSCAVTACIGLVPLPSRSATSTQELLTPSSMRCKYRLGASTFCLNSLPCMCCPGPDQEPCRLAFRVPGGVNFLEKWGYGVPPQEQVQSCFENIVQFLDLHCKGKAAVS